MRAASPLPPRSARAASTPSDSMRAAPVVRSTNSRRPPYPFNVRCLQSLAGLLDQVVGRVLLRDELLVDDLGRVVLLERGEAGPGGEQAAAAGRRVGGDVRGRHEVLGGGEVLAVALIGLADPGRGRRDDAL